MAWPTNSLSLSLEDLDRNLIRLKSQCTQWALVLSSTVDAPQVVNMFARLRNERAALAAVAAVPGIAAYAQAQKGDGQLDVVAEFQSITSAIDAVTNWISANIPKDGSGFLLISTLGSEGVEPRTFTAQQVSTLRTLVQALGATIS